RALVSEGTTTKATPEVRVTLSADLLRHLRRCASELEIPIEWPVAGLLCGTRDHFAHMGAWGEPECHAHAPNPDPLSRPGGSGPADFDGEIAGPPHRGSHQRSHGSPPDGAHRHRPGLGRCGPGRERRAGAADARAAQPWRGPRGPVIPTAAPGAGQGGAAVG